VRKPWKPSTSLLRALEAAPWRFAVTYAKTAPHWYITEQEAPALVAAMREAIAKRGYWGTWRGRRYRYLNVGGWKYWWIPPVLNREPLPGKEKTREG
jgi:hypothetical protein